MPLHMFQSTPAITGGRDRTGQAAGVTTETFQSTPAITGGRDAMITRTICRHCGFNPRPPLLAGETNDVVFVRDGLIVSIHARHYWRARPSSAEVNPSS